MQVIPLFAGDGVGVGEVPSNGSQELLALQTVGSHRAGEVPFVLIRGVMRERRMRHQADGEVLIVIELAKVADSGIGDYGADCAGERIPGHTNEPVFEPRVGDCRDSDGRLNEYGDDRDGGGA